MNLDILYKKSTTQAIQQWRISTQGNEIVTVWGQLGGAQQTTRETIASGKNIGRVNSTTPSEQAEAEALSRWEKKLKKGYVKNISDAEDGVVDDVILGGVLPMLAHKYSEQGHKIVWPAFAQPKLDGHRCMGVVENGVATLWSRTRKQITGLPHIVKDIEVWAERTNNLDIVLDGECYNHEYKENFEVLTSFIRSATPKPGHEVVQYHIYDIATEGMAFVDRHAIIAAFNLGKSLVPVRTIGVSNEEDLKAAMEEFLEQGYEGAMVRNLHGLYVHTRSYDLQKVKSFEDSEFKVIAVKEGRGKLAGHAIFVCAIGSGDTRMATGAEFDVKMKGKVAELKKFFDNPTSVIGKELTVQFQGVTKKNRVPRFPVGLRIRENL